MDKTLYWFLTGGWWIAVVFITGFAIWTAVGPNEHSAMLDDFNFSKSKQAVDNFYRVECRSVSNDTYADQYEFECSQTQGNYSYVAHATVEYNESGPDEVQLYQ